MELTPKQAHAAELLSEALTGSGLARDRAVLKIQESIGTTDLPVQLSPALTSIFMTGFDEVETTWDKYAGKLVVDDFESNDYYTFEWDDSDIPSKKDGREFYTDGLAPVGEFGEYPVIRFSASGLKLSTAKRGVQIGFSWEALRRNGKINLLKSALTQFGSRSKKTENLEAANQLVTASGVNTKNFKTNVDGNPELNMHTVEAALEQLFNTTNAKGRRLRTPSSYNLIVPSSLYGQAQGIFTAREIQRTDPVTNDIITMGNPVAGRIANVVEVPEIQDIVGANANKAWFLIPAKGPAENNSIVNVFLSGHESPKVFVKRDTNADPEEGSYENDSYATKVRHVVKGGFIPNVATLYSDGSGS